MRAELLEVSQDSSVRLRFDVGELVVQVLSMDELVAGDDAAVEFDVQGMLRLGHTAFATADRTYSVQNVGDSIQMCGIVDGVDPDGMVYLRLGPDSLTMIESLPGTFAESQWLRVLFPMELVCAYLTPCRTT